jgi:hypothetical protein
MKPLIQQTEQFFDGKHPDPGDPGEHFARHSYARERLECVLHRRKR